MVDIWVRNSKIWAFQAPNDRRNESQNHRSRLLQTKKKDWMRQSIFWNRLSLMTQIWMKSNKNSWKRWNIGMISWKTKEWISKKQFRFSSLVRIWLVFLYLSFLSELFIVLIVFMWLVVLVFHWLWTPIWRGQTECFTRRLEYNSWCDCQ